MASPAAEKAAGFLLAGFEVSVILPQKDDLTTSFLSFRGRTGIHPFSLPWREGDRGREDITLTPALSYRRERGLRTFLSGFPLLRKGVGMTPSVVGSTDSGDIDASGAT